VYLESIFLLGFKNYEELSLSFSQELNYITGENGSGKTNLLDAIHYLSMGRSAFNPQDAQNIRHGEEQFFIQGSFKQETETIPVSCGFSKAKKKSITQYKKPVEKISEYIGKYPVVMVAPDDTELVKEASETRRKFFDTIISQFDSEYLQQLIVYNNYLKQRNSLLKTFSEKNTFDADLIEPFSLKIKSVGKYLYQKRLKYMEDFLPFFRKHYKDISGDKEEVNLKYKSDLSTPDFNAAFDASIKKDLILQRTSLGIHRDDYLFDIGGYPVKKIGSQGQTKSFIISLRLAHYEIIETKRNIKPILLLDDIFDKIDDARTDQLFKKIGKGDFGQIFITDAKLSNYAKYFSNISLNKKSFTVNKGIVLEN